MNLRESIISSSFCHLILFLLIAAVSSHTSGLTGNLRNMTLVDLTGENGKLPAAASDSADESPLKASPQVREESITNEPSKESGETAETDRNVESPSEPAPIENAKQHSAGGFTGPEAYHQFIMMHKKLFMQKTGAKVNELLGAALEQNARQFFGGTATVRLKFDPAGILNEVRVDSESPDLKAFIEEIGWAAVPAPTDYSLRYAEVQITFVVLEGSMRYAIDTLF